MLGWCLCSSRLKEELGDQLGCWSLSGEISQGYNDFTRLILVDQVCLLRMTSVLKKYNVKKCIFISNLRDCQKTDIIIFLLSFFAAFFLLLLWILIGLIYSFRPLRTISMNKIKLSKNFTLSRKDMKVTPTAFKTNKTVADVIQEIFQTAGPSTATHRAALLCAFPSFKNY